jgi:hypothetical protein
MTEHLCNRLEVDGKTTEGKYTNLRGDYVPTLNAPPFSDRHLRGPRPLRDRIMAQSHALVPGKLNPPGLVMLGMVRVKVPLVVRRMRPNIGGPAEIRLTSRSRAGNFADPRILRCSTWLATRGFYPVLESSPEEGFTGTWPKTPRVIRLGGSSFVISDRPVR